MKREDLTFQTGFRVSVGNDRSQGAVMVLAKGGCEGEPDNRHKGADQWLVVISGTGAAVINGRKVPLRAGSMVLINHGVRKIQTRIAKTREPLGHVDPTPGIQLYSVLVLVNLEPPAGEFDLVQPFRALGRGWLENGGCRGD